MKQGERKQREMKLPGKGTPHGEEIESARTKALYKIQIIATIVGEAVMIISGIAYAVSRICFPEYSLLYIIPFVFGSLGTLLGAINLWRKIGKD